jgi:Glycosyltransferase Family 4
MQLTVLNVASPFAPVGPDAPGDAERVVAQLDEALVRGGHDSVVMACDGSGVEGILISMPRLADVPDDSGRHGIYRQYRIAIERLLKKWRFDLVHMHGADFYEYLPPSRVPVLVTLHSPPDSYPRGIFELDRPQTYLQCISSSQRQACPPCSCLLPEIQSGVGVENYFSIYEQLAREMVGLELWMAVREAVALPA